jgi:hypothetical protein
MQDVVVVLDFRSLRGHLWELGLTLGVNDILCCVGGVSVRNNHWNLDWKDGWIESSHAAVGSFVNGSRYWIWED